MRFVHGPVLYVMDVNSPIGTAWIGTLSAGLVHKEAL